jgi:nitrite reductase/ring-hydroxylating ferredoxin subunit
MESKVASVKDVPAGKMIGVDGGGQKIVVANVGGSYYAIGNTCTHRGCKLSQGTLNGQQVQCPCHSSVFDVKTGEVIKGPATKAEKSFKVKVEGEAVLVEV